MFDYIERFDNPRRRHSTQGQISPIEIESRCSGLASCPRERGKPSQTHVGCMGPNLAQLLRTGDGASRGIRVYVALRWWRTWGEFLKPFGRKASGAERIVKRRTALQASVK